ncbi:MAG: AZOBR_p60025 family cell surface glycopolymer formation protein [Chloroflexota bacterium]
MTRWLERYKTPALWINPAMLTGLVSTLLVLVVIALAGGDPLALARLGPRYAEGDPQGEPGYDGQFVYYMARDLRPAQVAPHLDVPAYRYQRILLPLLVRGLSLGKPEIIPWMLALLGILAQGAGTWAVAQLLKDWGVSPWYALVYGLWAGLLLAVIVDLTEPLAYGLVAGAFLALQRQRKLLGWALLGLAVFAKEVTVLFVVAVALAYLSERQWRSALGVSLLTGIPFFLFQLWLWSVFGQPGVGSGGDMATPFEWIPFMGIWRIGAFSVQYMIAMLVVFAPTIMLPAVWGVWKSLRFWLAGERNMVVLALLLNSLIIPFVPFSTFRETGGMLRFACGLVLTIILFAARYRQRRVLNYCFFWMVLNVFVLKSMII